MSVWGALAGGFVGTLVLTTVLRGSSELRITRMDLPFLLGTVFTPDRLRAKTIGYVVHFLFGLGFAMGYFVIFEAIGRSGWLLGGAFGLLHGTVIAATLIDLLPIVHPRMGTRFLAAVKTALIEPPGFMMLNYGRRTPIATILAHIAYGAIVGGFASMR